MEDDYRKVEMDYAKAHREDKAKREKRKAEKRKTRARNHQKATKVKKAAQEKKRTDLQVEAMKHSREKKAKRDEKVALETCPARKELRRLKHLRVRSFSVE